MSGCTFSKKTPTGEAGLRTLHQVATLLPPIALLKRIFWTAEPVVMALHVAELSAAAFSKVKPTQLSSALQRFSAAATVIFAEPCAVAHKESARRVHTETTQMRERGRLTRSFPAAMKPFETSYPSLRFPGSISVSFCWVPGFMCCVASAQ